jgi:hypothetical protein
MMKLWKVWSVFGAGTATLVGLLSYQAGCGGGDAPVAGQPPSKPGTKPSTQPTNVETFAIQTLLLGEYDRTTKAPSTTAWKSYGYNLDGKVTTKESTDVCTAAVKTNQIDGNNGIDNAFGSVILPIIQTAASLQTPSDTISTAIDKGDFTIQIQVTGLDDTPTQTATGLSGQLYASGSYGATAPTFDSTTDWPVNAQLLVNPTDVTKSSIVFPDAYVVNGTFVSGDLKAGGITVKISLVFQGVPLTLSVNHAVITFDHTTANDAANGTIAGVIDTSELITGLKSVAGRISQSLCGSAFDGIAQQITQASDIKKDGSNAAGGTCDGISIGLGFIGKKIANPTKIASDDGAVPPDPCSTDGGTPDTGAKETGAETSTDTGTGG